MQIYLIYLLTRINHFIWHTQQSLSVYKYNINVHKMYIINVEKKNVIA